MNLSLFALLLSSVAIRLSRSDPAPEPGVIYAAAPAERGAFHVGGKGVYNYGYNTGDGIAKVEVRHADGSVTGSYRYFDPLGRQIVRSYIADKKGFRVLGNDLPVAPDTPALGITDTQTLLAPAEGTKDPPAVQTVERREDPNSVFLLPPQHGYFTPEKKYFSRANEVYTPEQGYYSVNVGADSPYFYSNDKISYDFPAGFAYNTVPFYFVKPVGVQGFERALPLVAGHTGSSFGRQNRAFVTRSEAKGVRYPFIIGHAR